MDTKQKTGVAIIVVMVVVIGYFALSWAGVVPDKYNIVEYIFGQPEPSDNTTSTTDLDTTVTRVYGIPSIVNVSETNNSSYEIRFVANEGNCRDFSITLNIPNDCTNASVYISDASYDWTISPDGQYARFEGQSLIPYEQTTITLTIVGNSHTMPGSVMVVCLSNGHTYANEGLISIIV